LNGNENDNNEGNANAEVMAMNVIMMGGRSLDPEQNLTRTTTTLNSERFLSVI
jgi:hypothetical protein